MTTTGSNLMATQNSSDDDSDSIGASGTENEHANSRFTIHTHPASPDRLPQENADSSEGEESSEVKGPFRTTRGLKHTGHFRSSSLNSTSSFPLEQGTSQGLRGSQLTRYHRDVAVEKQDSLKHRVSRSHTWHAPDSPRRKSVLPLLEWDWAARNQPLTPTQRDTMTPQSQHKARMRRQRDIEDVPSKLKNGPSYLENITELNTPTKNHSEESLPRKHISHTSTLSSTSSLKRQLSRRRSESMIVRNSAIDIETREPISGDEPGYQLLKRIWEKDFWSKFFTPGMFQAFTLLGMMSMTSDYLLEYIVDFINEARLDLPDINESWGVRYIVWISYAVIVVGLAVVAIEKMSPVHFKTNQHSKSSFRYYWKVPTGAVRKTAGTGGIPELKAHLAGQSLPKWLSLQMYIAKFVGMILTLSSGLLVGKEGPFVHMACIIGRQIIDKFPMFKSLTTGCDSRQNARYDMLLASAAVGVASAFRAPIGGVLFSVEMTSASYLVYNYINCFFASAAGATMVYLVADHYRWSLVDYEYHPAMCTRGEIPIFIGIGLMSGILGSFYIECFRHLIRLKKRLKARLTSGQGFLSLSGTKFELMYSVFVAFVTALLVFPQGNYMIVTMRRSVSDLWTDVNLASNNTEVVDTLGVDNWGSTDSEVRKNCILYSLTVFVLSLLAITCPVVAGVFTPTMAIGAGVGRAIGSAVAATWPSMDVSVGGYALATAAAVSSGVTHTISTAVVVIETSGHAEYMLPTLIAVVLSVRISRGLQRSLYDTISVINDLPNLLAVSSNIADITASDVMWKHPPQLPQKTTLKTILRMIVYRGAGWSLDSPRRENEDIYFTQYACYDKCFRENERDQNIALILSHEHPYLMGRIERSQLIDILMSRAHNYARQCDEESEYTDSAQDFSAAEVMRSLGAQAQKTRRLQQMIPRNYRREYDNNNMNVLRWFLMRMEENDSLNESVDLLNFYIRTYSGQLVGEVTIENLNRVTHSKSYEDLKSSVLDPTEHYPPKEWISPPVPEAKAPEHKTVMEIFKSSTTKSESGDKTPEVSDDPSVEMNNSRISVRTSEV